MQYEWLMQKHILIYIGLVLLLSLIYFLIGRWIKKSKNSYESKRKSLFRLRGIFVLIFVAAFFITWASEIYSLIISITAIAAALAIATKEVILCYGGSFYRFFTHPFSVGDRIVIDDLRGDAVEIGLLGTQILEVGPKDLTHQYTGRLVTIPNAKFLSSTIFNETYSSDYSENECKPGGGYVKNNNNNNNGMFNSYGWGFNTQPLRLRGGRGNRGNRGGYRGMRRFNNYNYNNNSYFTGGNDRNSGGNSPSKASSPEDKSKNKKK